METATVVMLGVFILVVLITLFALVFVWISSNRAWWRTGEGSR
jgi:hypothetical protein